MNLRRINFNKSLVQQNYITYITLGHIVVSHIAIFPSQRDFSMNKYYIIPIRLNFAYYRR